MRITITQDFDTAEAAADFLAAHISRPAASPPIEIVLSPSVTRKPRADAGQARGPYKPRTTTNDGAPVGAGMGEAASGQPAAGTAAEAVKGSTPPAVSSTAAPAAPVAQAQEAQRAEPAPSAAATTLTNADARAALKKLNDAEGFGTEACLAALKVFGVVRISDVKPEQYADFIKHVEAQLPAEEK